MDESGVNSDPKLLLENNSRLEAALKSYRLEIDSLTTKYEKQSYLNLRLQFIISHLSSSLDNIIESLDSPVDYTISGLIIDSLNQYLSIDGDKILSDIDNNIANRLLSTVNNAKANLNKNSNVVKDFDYESLITSVFDKYLNSIYISFGQVNELRNEISRLVKQNDILYRKINSKNQETVIESNLNNNNSVQNDENITKLTSQCSELDVALQKSQNQLLSFKLNVYDKLKNEDLEYERLAFMFNNEKLSHLNEIKLLQDQILSINDENTKLSLEIRDLKSECDKLKQLCKISEDTLNDRIKLSESLKSKNNELNNEIIKLRELLNNKSSGDDLNSLKLKLSILEKNQSEYNLIKENLDNAINEIEEISIAFEEKQRQCENITRQLMLKPPSQTESYNVKMELDNLNLNFQKQLNLYNEKIKEYQVAIKLYIEGWNHSYQRSILIEQERDELLRYLHMSSERNTLLSRQLEDSKEKATIYGHRRKNFKPGDENKLIVRENAELIKRITCTVCNERFRDHVIIKCGHFFCEPCLDDNIKSRNRRCSQCKINFDKRDIQKIYF